MIKMKCHDLLYYMMRHFRVDFMMDESEIPHQWPKFTQEEIKVMFEKTREKYLNMIPEFTAYQLKEIEDISKSRKGVLNRMASSINVEALQEV